MARYTLEIDIPDTTSDRIRVEPTQRLRQFLKIALRGFGIRAVSVAEAKPGGDAPVTPTQEAPDHA